jgi:hypothetical protein
LSAAFAASRIETACLVSRAMRALAWLAFAWLLALMPVPARAADVLTLEAERSADGIRLDFGVRVVLPSAVEDALRRGVPLYFVARARVLRPRWYWRDERVARASRTWRLSYTPLTSSWRVSQGGLNQPYETLGEALLALSRLSGWKVADGTQIDPDERYEVEFSWGLDTSQLPPPMQIGIGAQPEWVIHVERTLELEPARRE